MDQTADTMIPSPPHSKVAVMLLIPRSLEVTPVAMTTVMKRTTMTPSLSKVHKYPHHIKLVMLDTARGTRRCSFQLVCYHNTSPCSVVLLISLLLHLPPFFFLLPLFHPPPPLQDPLQWSVDQVFQWLDWSQEKYHISRPINKYYFEMNGLGVVMIPKQGFIRRVGEKGILLYQDLHHRLKNTPKATTKRKPTNKL